jgi:hypothetical protein
MLDRLVRRAVLAEADGVVRVDHDLALLHQRRHADGVAGVVREDQEGGGVGNQAAVQRDAVGDGGHAEFAHAVVAVVAAFGAGDALAALDEGQVGAGQVGRAAEDFRHGRDQRGDGVLRGLAGGDVLGLGGRQRCRRPLVASQLAGSSPLMTRRSNSAASAGKAAR